MAEGIARLFPVTRSDVALGLGIHVLGIAGEIIITGAAGPAAICAIVVRRSCPTGVGLSLLHGQWKAALAGIGPGLFLKWGYIDANKGTS